MIERTEVDEETLGVATRWLELIDLGKFQAAWCSASTDLSAERKSASAFAAGTTEQKWCADVGNIRSSLGRVRSRRLESVSRQDEIGSVALRFATTFDQVDGARETVVVREDPDGLSRVAGYRIVLGTGGFAEPAHV